MIAKYYGKHYTTKTLRENSFITREGVSLKGISDAAEKIGFRTIGMKLSFEQLDNDATLPCILHWNQNHFIVLPPQNYNSKNKSSRITIVDPAHGEVKISKETFLKSWGSSNDGNGIALLLEPTPLFYSSNEEGEDNSNLGFIYNYLKPHRKYFIQLLLGMLLGSILSLIVPFLTQGLVDYGINQQNPGFIYIVLISQILLFVGSTAIEVVRSWLLLHMNTRINISIISDFLIKLMKLPIRFFDTKMIGDITQRINDHQRIEHFLTATSLTTFFSLINLLIFSIVLTVYSIKILLLFFIGSVISVVWIVLFLKKRKELDYARFQRMSDNQSNLFELITGMQEIKLNNSETDKRWSWERIQARIFKLNIKSLALEQYQMIGSTFFLQLKNILISYTSAYEVMNGHISMGMMLSISYIIGQMNSPIEQLLNFFKSAQDARISIHRLQEIHQKENEEGAGHKKRHIRNKQPVTLKEDAGGIKLENVSFQYEGPDSPLVLNNLNLTIPFGKVTAIVGTSGSGKTTLLKLLLKFYDPASGQIQVGNTNLQEISPAWWRSRCGVVMQDGYIFSDTLARNISVVDEIDDDRLLSAVSLANLDEFIQDLPLGLSTKIGNNGNGVSGGQKQRILIARAVYKNPEFLFFDEATSSLDANNERTIIENLDRFFSGRTVIVIAHRLSTVKYADQIIVLEKGKIAETGNHKSLTAQRGKYYELVKNQLELGN
jgi:ATP-binding cassette subfamily B protein